MVQQAQSGTKTVRLRMEVIDQIEARTNLPAEAAFTDKLHDVLARFEDHDTLPDGYWEDLEAKVGRLLDEKLDKGAW